MNGSTYFLPDRSADDSFIGLDFQERSESTDQYNLWSDGVPRPVATDLLGASPDLSAALAAAFCYQEKDARRSSSTCATNLTPKDTGDLQSQSFIDQALQRVTNDRCWLSADITNGSSASPSYSSSSDTRSEQSSPETVQSIGRVHLSSPETGAVNEVDSPSQSTSGYPDVEGPTVPCIRQEGQNDQPKPLYTGTYTQTESTTRRTSGDSNDAAYDDSACGGALPGQTAEPKSDAGIERNVSELPSGGPSLIALRAANILSPNQLCTLQKALQLLPNSRANHDRIEKAYGAIRLAQHIANMTVQMFGAHPEISTKLLEYQRLLASTIGELDYMAATTVPADVFPSAAYHLADGTVKYFNPSTTAKRTGRPKIDRANTVCEHCGAKQTPQWRYIRLSGPENSSTETMPGFQRTKRPSQVQEPYSNDPLTKSRICLCNACWLRYQKQNKRMRYAALASAQAPPPIPAQPVSVDRQSSQLSPDQLQQQTGSLGIQEEAAMCNIGPWLYGSPTSISGMKSSCPLVSDSPAGYPLLSNGASLGGASEAIASSDDLKGGGGDYGLWDFTPASQ